MTRPTTRYVQVGNDKDQHPGFNATGQRHHGQATGATGVQRTIRVGVHEPHPEPGVRTPGDDTAERGMKVRDPAVNVVIVAAQVR